MKPIDYPVNNIYACIQGEGTHTGLPMVMVRLQGCEVGCPWCDTKETWTADLKWRVVTLKEAVLWGATAHYAIVGAGEIADYVISRHVGPGWVLVSGGEPAQYDLYELVFELHRRGYKVALDTSGTEVGHVDAPFDWVTVSPKLGMPGGKLLKARAFSTATELKYPVGKAVDIENLEVLLGWGWLPKKAAICLQPLSQSEAATKLCIETCIRKGWRLSCQVHKYLNLP
jgi:7-carboxy-7-deazaguanine synthase